MTDQATQDEQTLPDHRTVVAGQVERPVRPLLERLRDVERDGMTFAGEAADEIERLRAAALAALDYLTGPATRNNATDKSAADALRAAIADRA